MKKILTLLILFVSCTFLCVNAECDYSTIQKYKTEASHIKVNYEVKEDVYSEDEYGFCDGTEECVMKYNYYEVSILNMTKDMYVKITNNYNEDEIILTYADADEDGVVKFNHKTIMVKVTYTLQFYASNETDCEGTLLKTYTKAMPRKNANAYLEICEDIPNADICQEYVFYDDISFDKFIKLAEETKETIEKKEESKKKIDEGFFGKLDEFLDENKWWIISGLVIVAGITTYIVIARKKAKNDKF